MRIFTNRRQELIAGFLGSELLIVLSALRAYFSLRDIKGPLILHFSPYTGINKIGTLGELMGAMATGAILIGINAILAFALDEREPFWGRIFVSITLFMAILLFMGFMAIISANS